jgi:hypothetical protein
MTSLNHWQYLLEATISSKSRILTNTTLNPMPLLTLYSKLPDNRRVALTVFT